MKTGDVLREAAMNLANNQPVEYFILNKMKGYRLTLFSLVHENGIPWTVGWLMHKADQLDGLS